MIFVGDTGTKIEISGQDGFDVSGGIEAKIFFVKPDKTTGEWVATIDTENNSIYYISQADTFDMEGKWSVQAYVDLGTWKGRSTIETFKVQDTLVPITP